MSKFHSRRSILFNSSLFLGALPLLMAARAADQAKAPSKSILFFGDSLTAGYGLDEPAAESYPAVIGTKLKTEAPEWKIVNAGLSGETTAAGLRRIDWILRQPVNIFVLALGANDGLRGIGAAVTRANLEAIIKKVRTRNPNAKVVLAGMKMPISMGGYARDFSAVFSALAEADKSLVHLPFLLEGVGGMAALNQNDAIHPNAEGHRKIADHVWKTLEPLIKQAG